METLLFSSRSLWTMFHGIVLGGGALLGLAAAVFTLYAVRGEIGFAVAERPARRLAGLTVATAAALWLTVLVGTYVTFAPYRATPPEGTTDLAAYPKARIQANPETAWLHSFAMETKEHLPWVAAIVTTAVAFVATRDRTRLVRDPRLARTTLALLSVALAIVAFASLLGIFVNKVAPLE